MAACAYLTWNYLFLVLLHDASMSAAVVFIILVTRCGAAPPGNCMRCCRFCCTVFWWELNSLESFWRKRLGVGLLRADVVLKNASVTWQTWRFPPSVLVRMSGNILSVIKAIRMRRSTVPPRCDWFPLPVFRSQRGRRNGLFVRGRRLFTGEVLFAVIRWVF